MVKSPMIVYGKQVCLHVLTRHEGKVRRVYLAKKGLLDRDLYARYRDRIVPIDNRRAQQLSRGGNHQGILLEIDEYEPADFESLKQGEFLVVLDGLTDAGNIGAIVRTAYALGVDGIVATGVNRLSFPALARTSSGALFEMPVAIRFNILDVLNECAQVGFIRYGATMEGAPVESKHFARKRLLVLGSEDKGLGKKTRERLDEAISITMRRPFDSLNVSAAAAIIIHRMSYATE
ncbi:TrmH family RNA methyltransferase [Nitratifractor sp.]